MASEVDKGVTGAAAASESTAKAKAPSAKATEEKDEGVEVHFNPAARVHTYVLADGETRVQDGDVVNQDVLSELQDVVLDGDKLLAEEEGE